MGKEIFKVSYKGRSYDVEANPGTSLETVWNSQKSWFASGNVEVTISDSKGNSAVFFGASPTPKKAYYFIMDAYSSLTGLRIGKKTGVIFAESEEEAEDVAWEKFGGENNCNLFVTEVPDNGYCFTVYRSEI